MKPTLLFLFTCCTFIAYTQAPRVNPAIQWQKSLGGTSDDYAYSIFPTSDGGSVVAGYSRSNDGDVTGNHGGYFWGDYWIVKLDSTGTIQWQKSLGGTYDDVAYSIQQTKDGGYIVAGYSQSNDGDVSGHHGSYYNLDYWIVKLDSNGNIQWQKSLGGTDNDVAYSIQQTKDGGYIVAGYSSSKDGDVSGHHGSTGYSDYWIVKLDSTGTIQWQKSLGGSDVDAAFSIDLTNDGGYIVAGYSYSNDGDVSGNHGYNDYWIVKLNRAGKIQWQKCLGGTIYDYAQSIQQTKDGGYIVAGVTQSNDGDVSGSHGGGDYWIVKIDSIGTIQWQKSLGGTSYDYAYSIDLTNDGGYIVAGNSYSNDGDVSGHHGGSNVFSDYWIVKLNSKGNIQKEESFGGSRSEIAYSIRLMKDGGYIVAGDSGSYDGDVTINKGSNDYWVVKLKPAKSFSDAENISVSENSNAITEKNTTTALHIQPNPSHNGLFTADLKEQQKNVIITVTDNSGKKIYADKLASAQQLTIFLNNKPKGIYYLQISYDGGSQTAKLVVE